jgi:uncharacterized membrane protein YedE/YeeE
VTALSCHLKLALLGLGFGFGLSAAGFGDPGELRRMFLLEDPRLLLTFGLAVVVTGAGLQILARGRTLGTVKLHAWTVPGGVLFGIGWALCGACPATALGQVGEGRWAALATVCGILAGALLGRRLQGWLRIDGGSC